MVGILLGAGASKRLGRPKQTLPFGDTTLLGHVLRDAPERKLLADCVAVREASPAEIDAYHPAARRPLPPPQKAQDRPET